MNLAWYEENSVSIDGSVGIDEVGRGPLAGPVVAACVWICYPLAMEMKHNSLVVRDSKKMTTNQRKGVIDWIKLQPSQKIQYSIASVTVEEIDEINILKATLRAMERSYNLLNIPAEYVLVDGNVAPTIPTAAVQAIVKGDSKVLSIALASIIAKEYRDDFMRKLALRYPDYGWKTNVGYGSKEHLEAISRYGITPYHRKTFMPVKASMENNKKIDY
ncbi:MAG: ribonuclease HII [Holosporaceae bacterium]|jgi:ribonuclease HII|nr:ribonuclease HII [Holosporaceae bacterium]